MAITMNDIYEILKNEGGRTPSEKVMEVSKDYPEKIAMRYKVFGIWQETTYKDFWLKSNYVSMALRFFSIMPSITSYPISSARSFSTLSNE